MRTDLSGRKFRLLVDLPIEKKHGAIKDAEFVCTENELCRGGRIFFIGMSGEECAAFPYEVEFINETPASE